MSTFREMGLPRLLIDALDTMSITIPTPIQAATIPLGLQGKDILGSAQTGTGKTLAVVLPLLDKLLKDPSATALVLTPTRELARQIFLIIKQLAVKEPQLKAALLIGGEAMFKQLQQLKGNCRIVVGTPGRVIDHLERKSFKPDATQFVVIDETDRMLDMGFDVQLNCIMGYLPKKRQTLMFSATLPDNIIRLASKYLYHPERVSVGSLSKPAPKIKQEILRVSESEKYEKFLLQINQREGSIIVFVKTKMGAEDLADKLCQENHSALAIHGDLRQHKRDRIINEFRRGRHRIMVATDVASRGLDIDHIQHVINYDLPQCPEDYIHRIGRTARAGAEGFALCLITPRDNRKWQAIYAMMNPGSTPSPSPKTANRQFKPSSGKRGDFKSKKRTTSSFSSSSDDAHKKRFGAKNKKRGFFSSDRPSYRKRSA